MTGAARGARVGLRRWGRVRWWLIPAALMLALSLPALFGQKWLTDAPRYTVVSMLMLDQGHWWSLSDGYGPYFNKPPLAFWLRAASMGLFGREVWAIKLPEVLAGIGCVVALADVVRRLHSRRAGMLAGIALAASPQFLWFIDASKLDYPHIFFMLMALRSGVIGAREGRERGVLWCGVWIGLALMTKPLSSLLVFPMLAAWFATAGRGAALRRVPAAVLVAALVAAPWHLSMVWLHGGLFTDQYFGSEMVRRAVGELHESGPWYYYFRYLRDHHAWWSGLAVVSLLSWPLFARTGRARSGIALAAIWTCGWLLAMTLFGGKVRYYLLQVYPGIAWLAGAWLAPLLGAWVVRRLVNRAAPVAVLAAVATSIVRSPEDARKHVLSEPHRDLIAFVRDHPEEDVWNESLKYWSAAIVYINTGRFMRAEGPPVTRDGQRNSPAPPGALEARIMPPKLPDPPGMVFRSGAFVIVRTPAAEEGAASGAR